MEEKLPQQNGNQNLFEGGVLGKKSAIWNVKWNAVWLEVYCEIPSTLSFNLRYESQSLHLWMNRLRHPLICFFFKKPLWNLNVCKDERHPPGGRGGAISRNPGTVHAAEPGNQLRHSLHPPRTVYKPPPGGRRAQESFPTPPPPLAPSLIRPPRFIHVFMQRTGD